MRLSALSLTIFLIIALLMVPIVVVSGHVPIFPGSNQSLETAQNIQDPTKSWAVFTDLPNGGETQYYRLDMQAGQTITLELNEPKSSADRGFVPTMALMGPGLETNGSPPSYVQRPNGSGVIVAGGSLPNQLGYEPFSPSALYDVGDIVITAPQTGTYYVAVYNNDTGGHYGLAVGERETFTFSEWVFIPIDQLSVYLWEGQSLLSIILPIMVGGALAIILAYLSLRNKHRTTDIWGMMMIAVAALTLGSAVGLVYQTAFSLSLTGWDASAILSTLFIVAGGLLSFFAIRSALRIRDGHVKKWARVGAIAIGVVAMFVWAGFIVGPVLAIITGLLPSSVATWKPPWSKK